MTSGEDETALTIFGCKSKAHPFANHFLTIRTGSHGLHPTGMESDLKESIEAEKEKDREKKHC